MEYGAADAEAISVIFWFWRIGSRRQSFDKLLSVRDPEEEVDNESGVDTARDAHLQIVQEGQRTRHCGPAAEQLTPLQRRRLARENSGETSGSAPESNRMPPADPQCWIHRADGYRQRIHRTAGERRQALEFWALIIRDSRCRKPELSADDAWHRPKKHRIFRSPRVDSPRSCPKCGRHHRQGWRKTR